MNEWKHFRYAVYEQLKDVHAQKSLAMEFVLNGDCEYFKKLKALYADDEWPNVLQNILEQAKDNNRNDIYAKIVIHENLKLRLLEYCKKNIHTIVAHYMHLLPDYQNDISMIFVKYITECAEHADNRRRYHEIGKLIKLHKKACGNAEAYALRDELTAKYPRRPAFLDELNKIK